MTTRSLRTERNDPMIRFMNRGSNNSSRVIGGETFGPDQVTKHFIHMNPPIKTLEKN